MPIFDRGMNAKVSKECAIYLMKHLFDIDMNIIAKDLDRDL